MNRTVSVAEAKNQLSDLLNRVLYGRERIIIAKRGKPVGALVSSDDLKKLEELEDRQLLERAHAVQEATEKYIPFDEFVRQYEKKWNVDLDSVEPEK